MKKFPLLFFILFFFACTTYAQEPALQWLKGYGGNGSDGMGVAVTKTNDGGFIIGIATNSAHGIGNIDTFSYCTTTGNYSSSFIKYNSDASSIEWVKCYDVDNDSSFGYLFPALDGGAVLGGEFNSDSGEGFLILKEDVIGNILWERSYSKGLSGLLKDMIATADGGYLMVGDVYYTDTNFTVHGSGSLLADIGIIKLDSIGNKVWSKAVGGTQDDFCKKVVEVSDGYYVLGSTSSNDSDCTGNHGGYDTYLVKLEKNGDILWHRDLGGTGEDGGDYAVDNGNGGVIIAGATNSQDGDITHPISLNDMYWAIDVDSNHNIIWDNCYGGGGGYCFPNSVCKALDGSIWMAGVSSNAGGRVDTAYGGEDAWIVHTDSEGNFVNAKVLGSDLQDEAFIVYPLSNGSIISGGYYSDGNGSFSSINYYGATDDFLAVFSSWTTKVPETLKTGDGIKIYPNPATDQVTITKGNVDNYSLEIYNSIGSIVYKTNLTDKVSVSVSDWPVGVYCVQVVGASGRRHALKLLVE